VKIKLVYEPWNPNSTFAYLLEISGGTLELAHGDQCSKLEQNILALKICDAMISR
jgi:hypothetical protein